MGPSPPCPVLLQMTIKLLGQGFLYYFSNNGNIFDCIITVGLMSICGPCLELSEEEGRGSVPTRHILLVL